MKRGVAEDGLGAFVEKWDFGFAAYLDIRPHLHPLCNA
jgi:hypothetical protein